MKKDIISKEALKAITEDIAIYLLGLRIDAVEFVDKELLRIEKREADIVATCLIDGKEAILHLEIQNANDAKMAQRMLRYRLDVMNLYGELPVFQYVVYIGKERLSMLDHLQSNGLLYDFTIVDMHQIDCEHLLALDTPDALVIAILCDFKGRDEKEVCYYIVNRLNELTKGNQQQLNKYTQMLETLSENRQLKPILKEIEAMLSAVTLEQLPSYEIGMERGIERGILDSAVKLISQLNLDPVDVAKRLGVALEDLQKALKAVKS